MSITRGFLLRFLAALTFASRGIAGMGDLDPGFGDQGVVRLPSDSGPTVIEMSDGRLLLVGVEAVNSTNNRFVLHRLQATGAPDPTLGAGQGIRIDWPGRDPVFVSEALQQPDGKIVIAGSIWNGGGQPFVARLDSGGSLDAGFASAGAWVGSGTEPFFSSLLQTTDGQLLASISDWTDDRIDWFASDGRYLGSLTSIIGTHRMAAQSDGRLVVTGYDRNLQRNVVMRLGQDGSVDRSFGQDGFATVGAGFIDFLSIEPGGDRILLCGPGIQRLTADGRPDISFGAAGTSVVGFGSSGVPAVNHCQGILALQGGGAAFLGIRKSLLPEGADQPLIGGLTSQGLVDTRFGSGSGASAIPLLIGKLPESAYFDLGSRLIRLRSGNALLSLDAGSGLWLARINLGGEAVSPTQIFPVLKRADPVVPPPVAPTPVSQVTPPITIHDGPLSVPTGGGALGAIELLLATAALIARRWRSRPLRSP